MSQLENVVASVIWEECLKFEKCIKIGWPINKKICVSVKACLRLVVRKGSVYLQVDAAGRSFEYKLSNACHTIYEVGVGRIQVCISTRGPQSIRLQAKACIGYGPINQCWDIWGADISWLSAEEFRGLVADDALVTPMELEALGDQEFVSIADEFHPLGLETPTEDGAAAA